MNWYILSDGLIAFTAQIACPIEEGYLHVDAVIIYVDDGASVGVDLLFVCSDAVDDLGLIGVAPKALVVH